MPRLLVAVVLLFASACQVQASEPYRRPSLRIVQIAQADESAASEACHKAPTRRCVAELALQAAAAYEDPMWRPTMFGMVAETYVTFGDLAPVLAAMTASGSEQEQIRGIASLARSIAKKDGVLARTALVRALDVAKSMDDGVPRLASYATIAGYAVDAGDLQTTRAVLEEVRRFPDMPPAMFVQFAFVRALAATGDIAGAMAAVDAVGTDADRLDALLQVVEFTKQPEVIAQARSSVAAALTEARAIESNEFHRESGEQGCSATYGQRDAALNKISKAQVGLGDFKAASATADEIEDDYVRALTLKDIDITLIKNGRHEEARRIGKMVVEASGQMEPGGCRMAPIYDLVSAHAEAGDYRSALKMLDASGNAVEPPQYMLGIIADAWLKSGDGVPAEGDVAPILRGMILVRTAAKLSAANNIGAAKSAISAAQSTVAEIADTRQRTAVLTHIAAVQAGFGDQAAVEATMKQLSDLSADQDNPDLEPLTASLQAVVHFKTGHLQQAVATADQIVEPWTRTQTLLQIANALPN